MKKQKRKFANSQIVNLTNTRSLTIYQLRDKVLVDSMTETIKYLQHERRKLLAKIRRQR